MRRKPKKSFISNAMRWRVGLLAVLMWVALMAPGLSRWLAASEGTTWVEVCSVQGMRWVQVDSGGDAYRPLDESAPKVMLDACAYCTLAADRPWLPSTLPHWTIVSPPTATPSTVVGQTAPQVWMLAPAARGPPLFL